MLNYNANQISSKAPEAPVFQEAVQRVLAQPGEGFHRLPEQEAMWQDVQGRAEQIATKFDEYVVIGMGGSSLGARTLVSALAKSSRPLYFWDSIDRLLIEKEIRKLKNLARTHFILSSKSGNTLESLALANVAVEILNQAKLNLKSHFTIVTENKTSPLKNFAIRHGLFCIDHPEDVCGRFSVLSPTGLLPAALAGVDLAALREGAQITPPMIEFVCRWASDVWTSWQRQQWISVFWSYDSQLESFTHWFQQLWAESLAKKNTRKQQAAPRVSTPMYCFGSRDQHSILQQFMEGSRDKFLIFFSQSLATDTKRYPNQFPELPHLNHHSLSSINQAEIQSCQKALAEVGVEFIDIQLQQLNEQQLGFLLMASELLIACLAEQLDVNAFDQPGVELGKRFAVEILTNEIM